MRVRFSIAGLLAAVFVLAVGFAGLRTASPLWASAVFTITVTLFAAAILGAAACRGPSRIAWLGFGVFGWTYLLATFWLWPEPNGATAPPFLTKALLDFFQPTNTPGVLTIETGFRGEMSTESPPMIGLGGGVGGMKNAVATPIRARVVNLFHYRRIGHTLAAIIFGLLGALLGTVFSARNEAADGRRPSMGNEAGP